MAKYNYISKLFLFDTVDFKEINNKYDIVDHAIEVEYIPGTIIQSAESPPLGIGIVIGGSATIYADSKPYSPMLRILPQGSEFGVASLFSNGYHTTCVIANEDCTVCYISKRMLEMLFEHEPQVSLNYIKFLSGRVTFLNKKLSTYTKNSAEEKLAYYLFESEPDADGNISVNYSQLAEILNIGRASLYRSLDKLSLNGLIERTSKSIKIINKDKLLDIK